MDIRRSRALLAAVVALIATLALSATAAANEPRWGVVTQGPLGARDYERMQRGKVATVRFLVHWGAIETAPGQFDWSFPDSVAAGAASGGIRMLPVVYGTPTWLTGHDRRPPLASEAQLAAWQGFLAALAGRYGPGGDFWVDRTRRLPVRRWQIWNEPNFRVYWAPDPDPAGYARLLAASAATLRAADPGAHIVLAGLAPVRDGMRWSRFFRRLYAQPGFAASFDVAAIHPYADTLNGMVEVIERGRRIMRRGGDAGAPLEVSELGWASSGAHPGLPLVRTPAGQARMLERSLQLLGERARAWRLAGVDWYSWRDYHQIEEGCSFCVNSGLFTLAGEAKPAWRALRKLTRKRRRG